MRDVEVATVLNGQVALECDFAASNPSPQVTWFANDTSLLEFSGSNPVQFVSGGRFLYLEQISTAQRMMRYHCSVNNSLYPNPMPMRAPTTYTLTGNLPQDNSVSVFFELGSMVGAVGEPLEFIYAATARGTDGDAILLASTCSASANPLVVLPATPRLPLVIATLTDVARDEAQVNFTCLLFGRNSVTQTITGTIIVSSE